MPGVETLTVFTDPQYASVSSKMVKEVAFYGGDLKGFVPERVASAIQSKLM